MLIPNNIISVEDADITERSDPLAKYRTKYDEPGKQLLILYASEYGFSEEVARKLFDRIADDETYQELSLQPRVVNAKDFKVLVFDKEQVLLCLFSTTGDGKETACTVMVAAIHSFSSQTLMCIR